jgi:CDP-6-deoxy-D-xylo-4-hexulose-3-dehydrase
MKKEKKIWYAPNKFESYGEQEIQAVVDCLKDGWIAGFGPRSIEFEEKIAKFFGKKYGVFVNSGSSACLLALASLQLPKGTKVITPACTFSTTLAPIIQL